MAADDVIVPQAEHQQLLKDQILLQALRGAGVDNWDGWDDAIESYHEMLAEEGLSDD